MKVNVCLDKMLAELFPRKLSYKNLIVLKRYLEGVAVPDIAKELGLKVETDATGSGVYHHLKTVRRVFGTRSDLQLAMLCYERGYVTITEEKS